jgi:hypothetical protein
MPEKSLLPTKGSYFFPQSPHPIDTPSIGTFLTLLEMKVKIALVV